MPLHRQDFPRPLSTVAIFGPGLIGGSIALALQKRRPDWSLRLWARSESSVARAKQFFPHATTDVAEAARGADLCVLCTPLGAMPALAHDLVPHLSAEAVVTDAGSVKGPVVSGLEPILGGRFVGAHPMAGSEKNGLEAARADLYEKAVCILTPTPQSDPSAVQKTREFWETVGCRIVTLSPEEHDDAVGRVSHLPHAAAAALVQAITRHSQAPLALAGGGYRDSTRIAASQPAMWSEILLSNKAALLAGLNDLTDSLDVLKTMILSDDATALEDFLRRAKETREAQP